MPRPASAFVIALTSAREMMGFYAVATMLLLLSARASAFAVRSLQPRGAGARLVRSRRFASSTRLAALQTTLSFDPSTDLRDKATSTLVVGRNSALKSIVDNPDAYVSLFGFRPHPEILSTMHESLHGNAASRVDEARRRECVRRAPTPRGCSERTAKADARAERSSSMVATA